MWEPDPSWRRLPGAGGPSSAGLWLAEADGRTWVVKRLAGAGRDEPGLLDPAHAGYWRREAEVARDPAVVGAAGLVPPEFGPVEEDDEGVTVWSAEVAGEPPPGLFVARALGRFAAAPYDAPAVGRATAARGPARDGRGARRLADAGAHDAGRRDRPALGSGAGTGCRAAPRRRQGRVHGDAVPTNFLGRSR